MLNGTEELAIPDNGRDRRSQAVDRPLARLGVQAMRGEGVELAIGQSRAERDTSLGSM